MVVVAFEEAFLRKIRSFLDIFPATLRWGSRQKQWFFRYD